jgi:mRNA interferase MazF
MTPKPGEIWQADLGLAGKVRPVVIMSREDPDPPRVLFGYVPLTSQYRESQYEVEIGKLPTLSAHSYANVQGVGSLPRPRLLRKIGRLTEEKMKQVKQALRYFYDL